MSVPDSLGTRGGKLWREVTEAHDLGPTESEVLLEACRTADRLDRLDSLLSGEGREWIDFEPMRRDDHEVRVTVDGLLSEVRQQQNIFKQLVAALRLPDESGKKPQRRGGARGAYKAGGTKVSSLDAARAKASG